MSNFPQSPLPDSNLTSWLARFLAAAKRSSLTDSQTLASNETPHGLTLEIADHAKPRQDVMVHLGEYVTGSAYAFQSVVHITSASVFTDGTTNYSCSANTTWVNISPVPMATLSSFSGNSYLAYYYSVAGRQTGVCYDPIDSPPTETPGYMVTGSAGKYWQLIAGGSGSVSSTSQTLLVWM